MKNSLLFTPLGREKACQFLRPLKAVATQTGFLIDGRDHLSDAQALTIISQSSNPPPNPPQPSTSVSFNTVVHYSKTFDVDTAFPALRRVFGVDRLQECGKPEPIFDTIDIGSQVDFIPQIGLRADGIWTRIEDVLVQIEARGYVPLGVRFLHGLLQNQSALSWLHTNGFRRLFIVGTVIDSKYYRYFKLTSRKQFTPTWKVSGHFGEMLSAGGFYFPVVKKELVPST